MGDTGFFGLRQGFGWQYQRITWFGAALKGIAPIYPPARSWQNSISVARAFGYSMATLRKPGRQLMNFQTKGLLITTLGVLFIVPDSLFVRLIDASGMAIVFWRSLLSGLVILAGLAVVSRGHPLAAIARTGALGRLYALFMGASGVFFVLAVENTSVASVVFILASMPVFAAIYSRILLGEAISRRMVVTIGGVLGGLAIIALGAGPTLSTGMLGNFFALCSAASFAAALTASRMARPASMVPAIPMAYLATALLVWPFADVFAIAPGQWWLVGLHGGVIIVVSTSLLSIGPRYITSAEVSLLMLLESLLAPLLVWAVLGEKPGQSVLIGGAIVVGVLVASNLIALRRRAR